jgi:hypothetical protein
MEIASEMKTVDIKSLFEGRKLLIATKHGKERVIAPLLENALGVECIIDPSFDSDRFGTFSGEVERLHDPVTTLRNKCLAALNDKACDLVIGNEGSFGPHPYIGMIPADDEWMMLIDQKNGWEIVARELSVETNFAGMEVQSLSELLAFAEKMKFPEHGLILRPSPKSQTDIHKGINDLSRLTDTFHRLIQKNETVYVETDMRALFNPTRMNVIGRLTEKLINTIQSICPSCQTPGFDVVEAIPGLSCSYCGLRTRSIKQHRYQCKQCQQEEIRNFPNGKEQEDPMYCDFCNP